MAGKKKGKKNNNQNVKVLNEDVESKKETPEKVDEIDSKDKEIPQFVKLQNENIVDNGEIYQNSNEEVEKIQIDGVYDQLLEYMKMFHLNFKEKNCETTSEYFVSKRSLQKITKLMNREWFAIVEMLQINIKKLTFEHLNHKNGKISQEESEEKGEVCQFSTDIEQSKSWGKNELSGLVDQMKSIDMHIQLKKDLEERAKKENEEKQIKVQSSKKVIKPSMKVSKKINTYEEREDSSSDEEEEEKIIIETVSTKIMNAHSSKKIEDVEAETETQLPETESEEKVVKTNNQIEESTKEVEITPSENKKIKLKSKVKKTFEIPEEDGDKNTIYHKEEIIDIENEKSPGVNDRDKTKLKGGRMVKIKNLKSEEEEDNEEKLKESTQEPSEVVESHSPVINKKIVKKLKKVNKKVEIRSNIIYTPVYDVINKLRLINLNKMEKLIYQSSSEPFEVTDFYGYVNYINLNNPEDIYNEDLHYLKVVDKNDFKVLVNRKRMLEIISDDEISEEAEVEVLDEKNNQVRIVKGVASAYIAHGDDIQDSYTNSCKYVFSQNIQLNMGEAIYVSGSCKELGNWDLSKAVELDCYGGYKWIRIKHINLKDLPFEYKYFISTYGKVTYVRWLGEDNIKVTNLHMLQISNSINLDNLNVMSFNLRYENTIDETNMWQNRKDLVINTLYDQRLHLLGVQEGRESQVAFLKENLKGVYCYTGRSRSADYNEEQCGIFVNNQKFFIQNCGQFWLSDNPHNVGSISFGNTFPRIVTWVRLYLISDIVKGEHNITRVFYYFNTHLDHMSKESRAPCVSVLLREIGKIISSSDENLQKNVIISGCFYSEDREEPIMLIKDAGFVSTSSEAENYQNTFHQFTGEGISQIDHIFYKIIGKEREVSGLTSEYTIIDERLSSPSGETIYLSDHFPILASINILSLWVTIKEFRSA